MRSSAGYLWLLEKYHLPVINLWQEALIDTSEKGRRKRDLGTQRIEVFEASYQPQDSLTAHLQFALRYEGINLQLLALLFEQTGENELVDWITQSPDSSYARRACFLYEWITGEELPIESPVPSKSRYVDVIDTAHQYGLNRRDRSQRFRVNNNLPGVSGFCPLVRVTPFLEEVRVKDLKALTRETLTRFDEDLLRRAAAFLYLKETQSSFEIEREKPSADRAQRFADLLRQADVNQPLTEERLVELQNAVVDPRFHEPTWRGQQNWVGEDLGYRKKIDFVPPRPDDLPELMTGLITAAQNFRQDLQNQEKAEGGLASFEAVIAAAMVAFGFVFLHPFMDGNGRIHRYLIHEVLANAGFTPKGIVLPVSAVILGNLDRYVATLEQFSTPLRGRTNYSPDFPEEPATGNDPVYFRYFDATEQAEFLCWALLQTIEQDLQQEIEYLIGFDEARRKLNNLLDWPAHSLDLFIRVVHDNQGELSKRKRDSHFEWMAEEEIAAGEAEVQQAFHLNQLD